MRCCHQCRLAYRQAHKAQEWEDKFSERHTATRKEFCPACLQYRTWWWFVYLPVTAAEIARFLARGDRRRELARENDVAVSEQGTSVQLED